MGQTMVSHSGREYAMQCCHQSPDASSTGSAVEKNLRPREGDGAPEYPNPQGARHWGARHELIKRPLASAALAPQEPTRRDKRAAFCGWAASIRATVEPSGNDPEQDDSHRD
jgi:hypothetical protein